VGSLGVGAGAQGEQGAQGQGKAAVMDAVGFYVFHGRHLNFSF
jgi:hypothetical protein